MGSLIMEYTGAGREYRIWRKASKRHPCAMKEYSSPHHIEPGEYYYEYLQMPGHDYNIDGTAPYRLRVCVQCCP